MKWVIPAAELTPADRSRVGGKAYVLSLLDKGGFAIPKTLCIPIEAYSAYIDQTGLRERIQAELFRKNFSEMRWEEMWDCCAAHPAHGFKKAAARGNGQRDSIRGDSGFWRPAGRPALLGSG